MDDRTQQSLLEECRELEQKINMKESQLSSLAQKMEWGDLKTCRPKRYSVELVFAPPPSVNPLPLDRDLLFLQPQTESFVVDAETYFRPLTVESSLRVTGNVKVYTQIGVAPPVVAEGQPASITLGWGVNNPNSDPGVFRNDLFDFNWEIRDTGEDRDWQNTPQPDVFLCTGRLAPLFLPIFGKMKGGSEIEVKVSPFVNLPISGIFFYDTQNDVSSITQMIVQISFHGYERIL